MSTLDDWRTAASQISNQTKNDYLNSNQALLDSINAKKDAELQGLANSNSTAINTLNNNKGTINSTALDNAKQANINRLLSLRDNQGAMSRAGLGSQGVVGSQVNSINNNYGTNLNSILKEKATGLRDIDKQINDTNLQYETNKSNLAAQYAQTYSQKQSDIQSTAIQLAQEAYNNYISQQQSAAELEAQQKQQEEANRLAWAQLRASNASNYGFNDSGTNYEVNTAYYKGDYNKDVIHGTFGNGYQPDNIGGTKLKSSGKTVAQMTGKQGNNNTSGINIDNQKVWKIGKTYYVWNGSKNHYESVSFK